MATASLVRRLLLALGGFILWLPLTAAFTASIPLSARIGIAALAIVSVARPYIGLLVFAALVPIADLVLGQLGATALRGPETLALTVLGGWVFSKTLRPVRDTQTAPSIAAATGVLAAVVLGSVLVMLAVLQAQTAFASDYVRRLATLLFTSYLFGPGDGELSALVQGAWLIEGAMLLFFARSLSLTNTAWRDACVRMLAAGGAAAAVLSMARLGRALLRATDPEALWYQVTIGLRLPAHVSDTNAAGSGFVAVLILALAGLYADRRHWWWWSAVLVLTFGGLLVSTSRSAIGAGAIVLIAFTVAALRKRQRAGAWRAAVAGAVSLLLLVGLVVALAPETMIGSRPMASLRLRWYFTEMSLRMIAVAPLFGVGLAQFRELSTMFMPEALKHYYFAENSHNYFLQVGAEIGLVGMIAFVVLTWTPVIRALRASTRGAIDFAAAGIAGAALAFLITTLTGHPFLTPAVAFPFWVMLGLCQAEADRPSVVSRARWSAGRWIALAAAIVAVSLPQRIAGELSRVDFGNIAYGVYEWERGPSDYRYRWTGPRARFFVPSSARLVEFPVRALRFDRAARPTYVEIALDGRPANHLAFSDNNWQDVKLLVPGGSGRQFRRIDLTVSPTFTPATLTPDSLDRRELGVIIGDVKITKLQ